MKSERGFGLLLVLIVLSFLAALGGALLTSTTLDVAIGDNYRTGIRLLYLAEAGIEEAREKMRLSARTPSQLLAESGGKPFVTGSEAGQYVVFLRNDVADGVDNPVDSNHVLKLQSIATIGKATKTIDATVMKSGFPILPGPLTLAGDPLLEAQLDPRLKTPAGIERVLDRIAASATDVYNTVSLRNVGHSGDYRVVVVNGDCWFGPGTGYGMLVVRGRLIIQGNFQWNGLILVVGDGEMVTSQDAYGNVLGGVFIARTRSDGKLLPVRNPPTADFRNGRIDIQADRGHTALTHYAFPYRPIATREF